MRATSSFLRSPDATDQASSALCSFIELCRGTLSTGCKRVYDRIHRSWSDLAVLVFAPSLPSVNSLFRNQIADWLGYSSLSNCTSSQVVNPILQVVDLVNTSNLCFIQLLCSCVRTTVRKVILYVVDLLTLCSIGCLVVFAKVVQILVLQPRNPIERMAVSIINYVHNTLLMHR